MRKLALITTIIASSITLAGTAQAATEEPTLATPIIGVIRVANGFTAFETYQIPEGDAAIITYKVYRHRSGPGFELVRTVHHIVGAADGTDSAMLRTPLWYGVGYRVRVRLLDVTTAIRIHAPVVKIHL